MKKVFGIIFIVVFCFACLKKKQDLPDDVVAEVNGNFLYEENIKEVMPYSLNNGDSVLFASNYIRNWATQILMYEKAEKNFSNIEEIEQLVADYRRLLIIHSYQQNLVEQRLGPLTAEQKKEFYEENLQLFELTDDIIKGIFMKVPLGAPNLDKLRTFYKMQKEDDISSIEQYSFQNASVYKYFEDKWISVDDLAKNMPIYSAACEAPFEKGSVIECQDSLYHYFLRVSDYEKSGSLSPYEYAEPRIEVLLQNKRKIDFINQFEEDLYQNAVKRGEIKIYR